MGGLSPLPTFLILHLFITHCHPFIKVENVGTLLPVFSIVLIKKISYNPITLGGFCLKIKTQDYCVDQKTYLATGF